MSQIYETKVTDINGQETTLETYKGKKLLIVNVASKCGFTKQYESLEGLYQKNKDKLVILGFPCNQFGAQEPGDEKEIKEFCSLTYNVSFPMFSKVEVNGSGTHPLYEILKKEAPGILGTKAIKWNFTKFYVNEMGKVVKRYAPNDTPEEIAKEILA